MSASALAAKAILLILAASCFAGFTWAILHLFRREASMPTTMRWLGLFGSLFTIVQFLAIVLSNPPLFLAVLGALLYISTLALFWWAVPFARKASLRLAFTQTQSTELLRDGPYRWVRHPFYASYMLFWISGTVATGQPWLLVSLFVMSGFYVTAIIREESELLARADLAEYPEYRSATGCLTPKIPISRLWKRARAAP
jgi:protein-S-isoprenylcysteine O-methyltransferase Ste14